MESKNESLEPELNEDSINGILIEQIKENYTRYVDNVWKTIQFLIIAIGWLLTSINAKETLASSSIIRFWGFIVILSLFFGHIFVENLFFRESQRIATKIKSRIVLLTSSDIKHWQISFNHILVNTVLVFTLFFFVFILVLKTPDLAP